MVGEGGALAYRGAVLRRDRSRPVRALTSVAVMLIAEVFEGWGELRARTLAYLREGADQCDEEAAEFLESCPVVDGELTDDWGGLQVTLRFGCSRAQREYFNDEYSSPYETLCRAMRAALSRGDANFAMSAQYMLPPELAAFDVGGPGDTGSAAPPALPAGR
jgi:hypothetical protein